MNEWLMHEQVVDDGSANRCQELLSLRGFVIASDPLLSLQQPLKL